MPVWRCPHCGTPQAESSRCWVCRRSTTTCATCLHFRRGIASGLGLCGLDPRRAALDGTEIRACWVAAAPIHADAPAELVPARELVLVGVADAAHRAPRTFVPVDELAPRDGEPGRSGQPRDRGGRRRRHRAANAPPVTAGERMVALG